MGFIIIFNENDGEYLLKKKPYDEILLIFIENCY